MRRFINGGRPTPRHEIENEVMPAFLGYYERFAGYRSWAAVETSTGRFVGWLHLRPAEGAPDESSSATGCADRRGVAASPPKAHGP